MATRPHLLIVEARFYEDIADAQYEGAKLALAAAGATHERPSSSNSPGMPGREDSRSIAYSPAV